MSLTLRSLPSLGIALIIIKGVSVDAAICRVLLRLVLDAAQIAVVKLLRHHHLGRWVVAWRGEHLALAHRHHRIMMRLLLWVLLLDHMVH